MTQLDVLEQLSLMKTSHFKYVPVWGKGFIKEIAQGVLDSDGLPAIDPKEVYEYLTTRQVNKIKELWYDTERKWLKTLSHIFFALLASGIC